MLRLHRDNPFHIIRTWSGACFKRTDLRTLGLRVQLGHKHSEICPGTAARTNAEKEAAKLDSFCVVDSNSIHEVGIDFCTCGGETSRVNQLLRTGLYPATTTRLRSAATFHVLWKFHKLSFKSKCSAYKFYNALARETNNTGSFQPQDRYSAFLCMMQEWRHLMMLKRSGRGHVTGGVRNIVPGACALLCPACPQPGKNLPLNGEWRSVERSKRFLYVLFLAIDTNFWMKRKQVSSEEADPGLNNGAVFFGEVTAYMKHVGKHWEMEQEKSTCVSHDAVDLPDREMQIAKLHPCLVHGLSTASSGIGTVDCTHHNMKRPNGVGDLQKGERYINMDYMLWMSLAGYDDLVQLMISYDIVCQWHINIWCHLVKYDPELVQRAGARFYIWLIPKWHLPALIEACNILYSFNLTPYIGRTDGKSPERGWANANPLAASTKEMGPGARRDMLDDHFNDWNHKKIITLGLVLLERIKKAGAEMVKKEQELVEMEASLPSETLKPWTTAMELWELDPSNPNPLQSCRPFMDESLRLRRLWRATSRGTHATVAQKTTMAERGNKLRRKIVSWMKTQSEFQPMVTSLRAVDDQAQASAAKSQLTAGIQVHATALWLPSKQARMPGSLETLKQSHMRYEFDLREGQAHEALEELRCLLLVRTYHYQFKERNTSGVAGGTRANTSIQVLNERIRHMADGYRTAHRALASLAPRLKETKRALVLKELKADDVRGMPRAHFHDLEQKKKKKKRRTEVAEPKEMSWIWRTGLNTVTTQVSSSEEAARKATDEDLRVEWAKTRARSRQWTEEVDLLEEEMRRVLVFLEWKAGWWRLLKPGRPTVVDPVLQCQAVIQDDMKARFEKTWQDMPCWIEMAREGVAAIRTDDEDEDDEEEGEGAGTEDDQDEPVPLWPRDPVAVSTSLVEGLLLPTT
ncbi:hypothetical protein FB451DRAFT_1341923 [Mycena latifolia]|nr:hypothetical protein FB451DRAFT_1341923 [Mycena latifolia]